MPSDRFACFWVAAAICILLGACSSSTAPDEPDGPAAPPAGWPDWEQDIDTSAGEVFHLDPVAGHLDNPGTAEAPWPGLQTVLEAGLVQRWES